MIRFDYEKIYTYFGHGLNIADGDKPSPLVLLTTLCALKPSFIDPLNYSVAAQSIAAFQQEHYKKLRVFTAIIDAFQPIHIFSGILPMQKLQIPPWILEQTLKKMVIVFRAGPLLIPGDIPTPAAIETATSAASDKNPNVTRAHIKIPVDAPSAGNWRWIQPVRDNKGNHSYQNFHTKTMDRSFHLPYGPLTDAEGLLSIEGPPHGVRRYKERPANINTPTTASSGNGGNATVARRPKVTMESVFSNAVRIRCVRRSLEHRIP